MVDRALPDGWRVCTLEEIGRIVTGKTPPTAYPEYYGGTTPFITPSDMDGRKVIASTERYLTEEGVEVVRGSLIPSGAVFVSCIGSDMGKVSMTGPRSVTNQQINSIVVEPPIDAEYVYYNLSTRKDEFQRLATSGSAQPILNKGHFSKLEILLPPLPEQRAIAAILGALDDKIELNRRMNETLEAMARALFKSWFVAFEPFRDQGMQDSPLGPIPKGWRVGKLDKIIELQYGKGLKDGDRRPGGTPVYGSNGQVGWHDETLVNGPGIVVGRKGNPGVVTWVPCDFYPIDTTFYVVPIGPIHSMYFLFHALQRLHLPSLGADSAVPGLNRNLAYMSDILIPTPDSVDSFDTIAKSWRDKAYANEQESLTLASIRDALLPKLLSREIRVKDSVGAVREPPLQGIAP